MNLKFLALSFLLASITGCSTLIQREPTAQDRTYSVQSVAKCVCDASMRVKSSDGKHSGFVRDDQKISSVTFKIGNDELVVTSPRKTIRAYYVTEATNPEILVAAKGADIDIDPKSRPQLLAFTMSGPLYDNVHARGAGY